jgi:hypothetical protein
MRLQQKRAGYKKRLGKEDLKSKLDQLSLFLRPEKFRNDYIGIERKRDFILGHCRWGTDIFRFFGLMMLPKEMEILVKTDLSLDKKASSGVIIYKSGKFSQDIQRLFS